MITICSNVHNKSFLIPCVIDSILRHSVLPFELIMVYDGCDDKSEDRVNHLLRKDKKDIVYDEFDIEGRNMAFNDTIGYNRIRSVKSIHLPNVFETISNNTAMKYASPDSSYYIIIQDDMIIEEDGWDKRIIKPLQIFDDVFAVTARQSFNYYPPPTLCDFREFAGRQETNGPRGSFNGKRNTFYIRDAINRGPVAFDAIKIKELNYFDESFSPFHWDDVDLSFRAYKHKKWKCGSYHIDYSSDLCWGSNRINAGQSEQNGGFKQDEETMRKAKSYQDISNNAWSKNLQQIYERHMDMLVSSKHSEDRIIDD